MSNERELLPLARTDALVIKELQDEVLVYDLKRHKAHCLNQASSIVWKHCDGRRSVAEMRRLLERELQTSIDEDVVWLALAQLRRFHLLETNGKRSEMKVTRRDLVQKYLPAALALPLILSIPSPAAAQAASTCGRGGDPCDDTRPCCPGFNCDGICFPD